MHKLIVIYDGEMLKFVDCLMFEEDGYVIHLGTNKLVRQLEPSKIKSYHYKTIKK